MSTVSKPHPLTELADFHKQHLYNHSKGKNYPKIFVDMVLTAFKQGFTSAQICRCCDGDKRFYYWLQSIKRHTRKKISLPPKRLSIVEDTDCQPKDPSIWVYLGDQVKIKMPSSALTKNFLHDLMKGV